MDEANNDPDFAGKFIKNKLLQIARESAEVGISAEEFEALVIALADELNFEDVM